MIVKIVSGGQTGADQGALDAAIALGIPHGGWIAKGRLTEDGRLPDKYQLKEMETANNARRTEQNVLDSDGTLIISHGELNGGSALTSEFAAKYRRPCLHIDLNTTAAFQAALMISSWTDQNQIEILNVAGPRASKDPEIYRFTRHIVESVYHMGIINENLPDLEKPSNSPPQNVEDAVERLISELPLKDRVTIANMTVEELPGLMTTLGSFIQSKFKLHSDGSLMESCRLLSSRSLDSVEQAVLFVIESLYHKLRETHRLRPV